jgi:hypothetical protein
VKGFRFLSVPEFPLSIALEKVAPQSGHFMRGNELGVISSLKEHARPGNKSRIKYSIIYY